MVDNKRDSFLEETQGAAREFDLAWKEFFKEKKRPRNEEKEKEQMEKFLQWYNHERKQSDTGKTPAEMHEEIYGKKPSGELSDPSRVMHFEWDEEYKEPDELFSEADRFIQQDNYKKALVCVEQILEIMPDDEEAMLIQIEVLNYLNHFDEAETCTKRFEKLYGQKQGYPDFYRAQRYFLRGNFFQAFRYMRQAYDKEEGQFDFVVGLANYASLKKDNLWREYFAQAQELDRKRADSFKKKFWLEPKEMFDGGFGFAMLDCIDVLLKEENVSEALENIRFLLLHEDVIDVELMQIALGLEVECFLVAHQLHEVAVKIKELKGRNKENPHAYFYQAQLLFEQNDLDGALKEIDLCLDIAEQGVPHPDFYLLKSIILKRLDDDDYEYYERKANELRKGAELLKEFFEEMGEEDEGDD